jgi:hypothetical protein
MVLIAACLGLRTSEIIGLQWGDFNWEDLMLLCEAKCCPRASRRYEDGSFAVSSSG